MPLILQPSQQRARRGISMLGTVLSAATLGSLNSQQQSALHQNLNSMPMESLLQVRKQQLDGAENLGAILDGASIVPGVGSLFKMVNLFVKDQQGQSIADPYIAQTARNEVQHWREMLASQQSLNFYGMATGLYQSAIDRAFDPLMPSNVKDSYQAFLFKSLSDTVVRLDGQVKDLSQGLGKLAPSPEVVRQTSIAEMQGFTSLVSEKISSIQASMQILNKKVAANTEQIALLKSQVSSLDLTIKNHEWRIDHLELISEAMFDEFKKVDTLGFEKHSKEIAALKSSYDAVLEKGSAEQIIAARTALTSGMKIYNDRVKDLQTQMKWFNGAASLISGLASAFGKPEIKQAVEIIQGVAQVGLGIAAFIQQGAMLTAMGGFVGAGVAIAMGIAAIYMSSKKSSGGGNGIGQALAQISQQIQALAEQIQRLGVHIDNRFDRVEDLIQILSDRNQRLIMRTFESMVDLLDDFRQDIIKQFITTQGKLDSMGVLLNTLSNKLDSILAVADAGFRTLYQGQDRYARTLAVVRYYENQVYGQVPFLQTRELRDALVALADWASTDAKHQVFHKDLANDYSWEALSQVSPDEFWNAVNLILGFIRSSQGLGLTLDEKPLSLNLTRPLLGVSCASETLTQRVVNPAVWQEVIGYLQRFAVTLPEMQFLLNDRCLVQRVITSGESFLRAVLALRAHPDIFPRLIAGYNTAFEQWVGLMYAQVVKELGITPSDIWTQMQIVQGKLGDVRDVLTQLQTSLIALQSSAQAITDLILNTCSLMVSNGSPYAGFTQKKCYDDSSDLYYAGRVYSLNYTALEDCHANNNYMISKSNGDKLKTFTGLDLQSVFAAISVVSQVLSYDPFIPDAQFNQIIAKLSAEGLLSINQTMVNFNKNLSLVLNAISSSLQNFSGIKTCYSFTYIKSSPGGRGPAVISSFNNYGADQLSQFKAFFDLLQREFSTKTNPLYQQALECFTLFTQAHMALIKRLTLTEQLGLDIGLFNATIFMPNVTFPENAPLAQKRLVLLNNFVAQQAGAQELAAVARALLAMKDAPAAIIAQAQMQQHRHALSLILPLAFNEEFYADPIIQEMLRALWSGDQFKAALDAFDPRDNTTFPLNSLQQSFFPEFEGKSYQLLALMKDYLNQTVVRGQEGLKAGTLSPGYFKMNQLLEQLYILRDLLIGQVDSTSTSTIAASSVTVKTSVQTSSVSTVSSSATTVVQSTDATTTVVQSTNPATTTLALSTFSESPAKDKETSGNSGNQDTDSGISETTIIIIAALAALTVISVTALVVSSRRHRVGNARFDGQNSVLGVNYQNPVYNPAAGALAGGVFLDRVAGSTAKIIHSSTNAADETSLESPSQKNQEPSWWARMTNLFSNSAEDKADASENMTAGETELPAYSSSFNEQLPLMQLALHYFMRQSSVYQQREKTAADVDVLKELRNTLKSQQAALNSMRQDPVSEEVFGETLADWQSKIERHLNRVAEFLKAKTLCDDDLTGLKTAVNHIEDKLEKLVEHQETLSEWIDEEDVMLVSGKHWEYKYFAAMERLSRKLVEDVCEDEDAPYQHHAARNTSSYSSPSFWAVQSGASVVNQIRAVNQEQQSSSARLIR